MALSDASILDHNPGNDVLRFDLRLTTKDTKQCFCLEGLACDPAWREWDRGKKMRNCVDTNDLMMSNNYSSITEFFLSPVTKWDSARFLTIAADPWERHPFKDHKDELLHSEQAHAFFPLFPLLIRHLALFLVKIVPLSLLPPTFEGVLALSALLLNFISFLIALHCLLDLTLILTQRYIEIGDNSLYITGKIAAIFYLNPATIFFCTCYTEAVFAMFTFAGYCLYTREYSNTALLPWMAASYTRSNGCLVSVWLIIQGIAQYFQKDCPSIQKFSRVLWHFAAAIIVGIPILLHDRTGYELHCQDNVMRQPYCDKNSIFFYGYVQRKYWDVGLFRYFCLKQIPNFILATPILFCSVLGAWNWIRTSWNEQPHNHSGVLPRFFKWAIWALQRSKIENYLNHCDSFSDILYAPNMLAHYAILAIAAVVGFTTAHVQISTRLICSTCPAIYWQLTRMCLTTTKTNESKASKPSTGKWNGLVTFYLGFYIVVGIILHVNFLPWT